MTASRRIGARVALTLLVVAGLSGCQLDRLQFRNDDRLTFETPKARHRVTVPLTVAWRMRDFTPTGLDGRGERGRGVFAVFVDKAPMPVGEDLKWLFRDDPSCRTDRRCPSTEQLAARGVYVTTRSSLTLDVLPQASDGVGDEQHYVNVVLLDGAGRRLGESAWYLPFRTRRRSS